MPAIAANNANAMKLWELGMVAATNIPVSTNFLQTSALANDPQAIAYQNGIGGQAKPILNNVVLKGGFNAVRVFLSLGNHNAAGGGEEHDITTIARLTTSTVSGWADSTVVRNDKRDWVIPRYHLLAAQIDNLLELCGRLGIGVILAADDFYSTACGALWSDQALQDQLVTFWRTTAKRWASRPALIGFELLNEPDPGRLCAGPSPMMTYSAMRASGNLNNYKALMERCITAIRASDTTTPVIVSTIHGGNPKGFAFFQNDASGTSRLVADVSPSGVTINKIVYTCHVYTGSRYTHQGTSADQYHALGLCYPNFRASELEYGDGVETRPSYDFRTNGMAVALAAAKSFRQTYNKPVFVGEFSAASSAYQQRAARNTGEFTERAVTVARNASVRSIVGLNYDAATQEGVLVMARAVALYDVTEVDAQGRDWSRNRVDVQIEPAPTSTPPQIAPFDQLGVLPAVTLEGNWYPSPTATSGDENFLIRFKWPAGRPAPTQNFGISHMVDGRPRTPGEFRALFEASAPQQLATLTIVLSDAQVQAQEQSRVLYARDLLRQCAAGGLSWAWFAEYETVDTYPYGNKFWQIDSAAHGVLQSGGKMRALLRRAAHQSYE